MKLPIESFATLFLVVILLGGCSGCGQKSAPETPVTPPNQSTPDSTHNLSGVKQNGTKPKPRGKTAKLSAEQFTDSEYLATLKGVDSVEISRENIGGIPFPWDPLFVSIEWWQRYGERLDELRIARRQKTITAEEHYEKILQILREYGLVAYAQLSIELNGGGVDHTDRNLVNLAYAEDPDDFDTLLMWVSAGGNKGDLRYGEKKTAVAQRLYEMNPDHPWVLHYLAKCLLGSNPQEALGYAQKAQELDPRYLPFGIEGMCYFQMGDYQKALASFRRSHQYAVATSQPSYIIGAISSLFLTAEDVVNSGGKGEDVREKLRKAGHPILGPDLPTPLRR